MRLAFATLVLIAIAAVVPVEAASCRATAQLNRDQCTRERSGDRERSRQCLDNYLVALDRCEQGGYDPVNPPLPRGRTDPLNPPTARSQPVVPKVNPRPTPVQPRIQRPRIQPNTPYNQRVRP
jgi:hypothetical protein